MCNKFKELYKIYKLFSKETLNIPITKTHQIEMKYRHLREKSLPMIDFQYPEIQEQKHDFIIRGDKNYKIQEKARTKRDHNDRNYISFTIRKCNGNKNHSPYSKGDNDFYWFHMPDENTLCYTRDRIIR